MSSGLIQNDKLIGVLGAGQLGRMIYLASCPLGLNNNFRFLDPNGPKSSVSTVAPSALVQQGSFREYEQVINFVVANQLKVLTVEIEHVNIAALEAIEQSQQSNGEDRVEIIPRAGVLKKIKDKYLQKTVLQDHKVPVGAFAKMKVMDKVEMLETVAALGGFPIMVKTRREGYDGRGNFLVKTKEELYSLAEKVKNDFNPVSPDDTLLAERLLQFQAELSVIVVVDQLGNRSTYPVVETFQQEHVCSLVVSPPTFELSSKTEQLISSVAVEAVRALHCDEKSTVGVFAVELFYLDEETVYVNEIAPRVHNSGHLTLGANVTCQFENLARVVAGLPLGSTERKVGAAAMVNILGRPSEPELVSMLKEVCADSGAHGSYKIHWYGKYPNKLGRKMGHLTFTAPSVSQLMDQLFRLESVEDLELAPTLNKLRERIAASTFPTLPPAFSRERTASVAVIMGSDSDLPVMKPGLERLEEFQVPYVVDIVSAHRTPNYMVDFASSAVKRGIKVIIAGAGGAAHLPGMVASLTDLPVIGVPVKTSALSGVDSLYSIVQMPRGVPVATVAINNSVNAALLAIKILQTTGSDPSQRGKKLIGEFTESQRKVVEVKASYLRQVGWKQYLEEGGVNNYKPYVLYALENPEREVISNVDLKTCSEPQEGRSTMSLYRGKVRDCFFGRDKCAIVSTDRMSGFDRSLGLVPFKGQVLNLISQWWFSKTAHIISNHLLSVDEFVGHCGLSPLSAVRNESLGNVTFARKCDTFPVEFVVRGYLTGSTSTSIWTAYDTFYNKGKRKAVDEPAHHSDAQGNGTLDGGDVEKSQAGDRVLVYCGHSILPGKKKNDPLDEIICTPTTKSAIRDELISKAEIVSTGLMTEEEFTYCEQKALELFKFGQAEASKKGLILVDTKYEFGRITLSESKKDGSAAHEDSKESRIVLCDEIHTPDCSRYWLSESYLERVKNNLPPESFDKEFYRLWFKKSCEEIGESIYAIDQEKIPEPPKEIVAEMSMKYIHIYETITGRKFNFALRGHHRDTKKQEIARLLERVAI